MWGKLRIFVHSILNTGTMKVSLIIKKSVKRYDTDSQATIYVRLRDGRTVDMVAPTSLTINPNLWDDKAEQIKSKVVCDDNLRTSINDEVRKLKSYLEKAYQSKEEEATKDWLKITLDKYYNPKKYYTEEEVAAEYMPTLIELFELFLEKHKLSEVRKKNYRVVVRTLKRYELYVRTTKRGQKGFTLYVDDVTSDKIGRAHV